MEEVAEWYEKGGQQYIYIEDMLTTGKGLTSPNDKIPIPPPEVVYGRDGVEGTKIEEWREAHLASIMVDSKYPEMSALEQRLDVVIEVRLDEERSDFLTTSAEGWSEVTATL